MQELFGGPEMLLLSCKSFKGSLKRSEYLAGLVQTEHAMEMGNLYQEKMRLRDNNRNRER